jgi:hypothetical protein
MMAQVVADASMDEFFNFTEASFQEQPEIHQAVVDNSPESFVTSPQSTESK